MPTDDFDFTYTEEPHASRRAVILAAHPEIKKLFGYHWISKWICAGTVALQVACAYYCSLPTTSWLAFFLIAYFIGGTANHSLTLAIHEMSHHLFFSSTNHNIYYSFFANFPLVIPYSASFKKYHLDHHRYQGEDGIDTDIPTAIEGFFFTSPFKKFLWVLFQPFFYAIRPLYICPKGLTSRDVMNICTQSVFLYAMIKTCGWTSIGYLLASTWMGLGFHPCAGHFIAEHYTNLSSTSGPHKTGMSPFKEGGKERGEELYPDETFSYRGPLNYFSYDVGYHVAHHDFPKVPGWRLREVEAIAPEFYRHLPTTKSWPGTIYDYIMGEGIPFDRVKRANSKLKEPERQKSGSKKTQ